MCAVTLTPISSFVRLRRFHDGLLEGLLWWLPRTSMIYEDFARDTKSTYYRARPNQYTDPMTFSFTVSVVDQQVGVITCLTLT